MGISEHAAYIKGLFEGYELDTTSKEGRIISELITLVADMSDKINALEADNKELHEYVEELDHDLGEVEEEVYFFDDDEDYEDYDDLNDLTTMRILMTRSLTATMRSSVLPAAISFALTNLLISRILFVPHAARRSAT